MAPSTVAGPERCCCYTRYSDAQRDVAFSIATAGGFEVPMRALESQGADPNARTEGGDTAVMWAAQGCQLQSLTILHDIGWHAVVWAGSNAPGMVTATRKLADLGMDVKAARRPASTRAASGSRCARG